MNKDVVCKDYVEFFDILNQAKLNKKTIIRADDELSLNCGVIIDNQRYLLRLSEIKCAKDAGINTSIYLSLKGE